MAKPGSSNAMALDEYEIHFAQPTSPLADALKLRAGGWVLTQSGDRHSSFDSYKDVLNFATKLPSVPGRWSVDHPLNAHFVPT